MSQKDYNRLYAITMKSVFFCVISICLTAYVKASPHPPEIIEDISIILPKIILVVIPLEIFGWITLKKNKENQ